MVWGPKRFPVGAGKESAVVWGTCGSVPVGEGESMVEGGPTYVDRSGRQGWPLVSDVVAVTLSKG